MKIIGNLFFSKSIPVGHAEIGELQNNYNRLYGLRLFCKELNIDNMLLLGFKKEPSGKQYLFLKEEFENYRVLSLLCGKKVYLQLKDGKLPFREYSNGQVMQIPFYYENLEGILVLNAGHLEYLRTILGMEAHKTSSLKELQSNVDKRIYQTLSMPPKDYKGAILKLSDKSLQLLLNRILHTNIASLDMLAAFIYGLGEIGQRLTDNLSSRVKHEVNEKVRSAKLSITYRWANEVEYIIGRNIMSAARELSIGIPGLGSIEHIRMLYQSIVLKSRLDNKSLTDWLLEFSADGRLMGLFNQIKRSVFTKALAGCNTDTVISAFKPYISTEGIRLMLDDIDAAGHIPVTEKMKAMFELYRIINEYHYAPAVKLMLFEDEVEKLVTESYCIDLIADEIGFAKTVFALKNMPKGWLDRVLSDVLRNIFEDVIHKEIIIKNYDDYRMDECRRKFLTAALILHDEQKI